MQGLHLTSDSDEDVESEEGTGNRLERERGPGKSSRRRARSALSHKGATASTQGRGNARRRRDRSAGLSYTEVRPYHHQVGSCLVCSLRQTHQPQLAHRERKISAGSYHARARTGNIYSFDMTFSVV